MITKKVNRYWCEFCGKQGGSKGHIAKHEKSCTMNPNRICRVCKMVQGKQKPIAKLTAFFAGIKPDLSPCENLPPATYSSGMIDKVNQGVKELREFCDNCPACIMAALRQSKIPVPMVSEFNWGKEMQSIWDEINQERL